QGVSPRLRRRRGFGRPVPLPPDTSLTAPLPPRQTGYCVLQLARQYGGELAAAHACVSTHEHRGAALSVQRWPVVVVHGQAPASPSRYQYPAAIGASVDR